MVDFVLPPWNIKHGLWRWEGFYVDRGIIEDYLAIILATQRVQASQRILDDDSYRDLQLNNEASTYI